MKRIFLSSTLAMSLVTTGFAQTKLDEIFITTATKN